MGTLPGWNRYIVECKSRTTTTAWMSTICWNRYIVECKFFYPVDKIRKSPVEIDT